MAPIKDNTEESIKTGAKTKRESTAERWQRMAAKEEALRQSGFRFIAGADEAGRGPLAGPVYAAAVILDPEQPILGLNDSKKLSEKKREALAAEIKEKALAWAICACGPELIDEINILEATKAAMTEAIRTLQLQPDYLLLDALQLQDFPAERQESVIKGDAVCNAIAAASILAKTARDEEMRRLDKIFPGYGFARHKGYGTAAHYAALDKLGPSAIHRRSFLRSWYAKRMKP